MSVIYNLLIVPITDFCPSQISIQLHGLAVANLATTDAALAQWTGQDI